MPRSLWLLLWFNARAAVRRSGRQARTVKGAIFLVVGVVVAVTWVVPQVFFYSRTPAANPDVVRAAMPVVILGFCVLNLLTSAGERAVTFTPAEVDFLFPGPFTRRQLLGYKLVKTGMASTLSALIFGLILGKYGGSYVCRVVGVWLTFQFLQGVAMVAALVQTSIGERAFTAGRKWVLVAGLAVAVGLVAPGAWARRDVRPTELAARLQESRSGRALLAPFGVFARAMMTPRLAAAVPWDAAAVAIDLGLATAVVLLDANYLEAAATASAKRYDRVARVRKGGLAGMANPKAAGLRVPMVPWLGGVGPVAWRQLTGVVRTSRGLLVILGILAVGVGGAVGHASREPNALFSVLLLGGGVTLFLASLLRFDFRGDLDHIDVLRSLPLRPTAVAAAELVAPTVVLSGVQALLLAAVAAFGHVPALWLVGAVVFAVPLNALLMGTENLLFLLFPFRPTPAVAGDMGMVGRQSVVFFCRLLALLVAMGIAAGFGAGAYLVTGHSWAVAAVAAWVPLVAAIVAVVWLLGLVYDRFDPSVETPM